VNEPFQVFLLVGLTLFAIFMLLPVIFILNHAFKPIGELFAYPPQFFVDQPTLFNFQRLMLQTATLVVPFSRYLFNSILTSGVTVIGIIMVSSMAAYAFSKLEYPGNRFFNWLIIVSLMFAPEAVGIPKYLVVSELGLSNTYLVHTLPLIATPVAVFLLKQFVDQIPNELLEAMKIDGAGDWMIYLRLVLPMTLPAIATVGILSFQNSWIQVETSNLYITKEAYRTLPYYVATLTNGSANNVVGQGIAAAAALFLFVPNIIMFLVFQRRVMATMAHSGIK